MRFANDFHSWLRHSWKLLANRLTRDPKIVIHGNSCIILYIIISAAKWSPFCLGLNVLTHWGRDKMTTIFRMTFSNAFSWMKMFKFWLNFTEVCSQGSNYEHSSIGSDNGLVLARQQVIIWNNDGKFTDTYMCHSASMSKKTEQKDQHSDDFIVSWWINSLRSSEAFMRQ